MNIRIGRISQFLTPAYGACARCHTTWAFVREHTTGFCDHVGAADAHGWCGAFYNVSESGRTLITKRRLFCRGLFALCEKCWGELATAEARMPYYRDLYDRWARDVEWGVIEAAVMREASGVDEVTR